ncbi:MAG TPA: TRAM domain-containing protein [Thermoanaerobaculia bacterium]|nr:TRAM domain-containing protein [Thermoanaerobaculia bacterium]
MREGDVLTITPTELVAGGDALARIDGFPVFASNVFPGDVARVRLYEVKKGFAKADVVELVTPSEWRRAMPCPIAEECGGCDWTALRLDKQLEAKQRILTESLRRIGKLDVATLPRIDVHPSPLNYRLRSRLHRDGDAVGFFAMRSNRVVPLSPACEVVGVKTAHAPSEGQQWELDHEVVRDDRELTLRVNEFAYRLHTQAFFQVNRHLLGTMIRLIGQLASRVRNRRTAVDLYGGVGFFTLPLAKLFERVTLIEGSPVSAHYARRNVPKNVKVIEAPVEAKMRTLPDVDFTFLDPPRAGARREVISTIAERTREMIVFLACDPVTFARDASRLIASGWRLSTLDLLDLFPNTHHVETLSSFERAQ